MLISAALVIFPHNLEHCLYLWDKVILFTLRDQQNWSDFYIFMKVVQGWDMTEVQSIVDTTPSFIPHIGAWMPQACHILFVALLE
jgi:hypothetical protein